jgi:hypothetical protein
VEQRNGKDDSKTTKVKENVARKLAKENSKNQ